MSVDQALPRESQQGRHERPCAPVLVRDAQTNAARPAFPTALKDHLVEHGRALKQALGKRFGSPPPDPDDAIQNAILKFIEIDRADTVRDVRAFLFALARNLMLDELRKMKVRASYREQEIVDIDAFAAHEHVSPETAILNRERYRMLDRAIASLDEEARQILMLSRIENLSYSDISQRTGRSPAHISRSIQKSLKDLSEFLIRNGLEER